MVTAPGRVAVPYSGGIMMLGTRDGKVVKDWKSKQGPYVADGVLSADGKADCLLGGATYSTADTIRPALQLVKTKKGAHLVSSCFILDRDCGEEGLKRIAMGDCAVNIDYTDTVDKATGEVKISAASKLAEVAVETARTAKLFGIDPKVAVLSFSDTGYCQQHPEESYRSNVVLPLALAKTGVRLVAFSPSRRAATSVGRRSAGTIRTAGSCVCGAGALPCVRL